MLLASDLMQVTWRCVRFDEAEDIQDLKAALVKNDIRLFELSGASLETKQELLSAVAEAMSFPDYFGMNWDALNDCLRDMCWLRARGYVLFVHDAEPLWVRSPRLAAGLVRAWLTAAEFWSTQGVSFHLVFVW